MREAVRHVQVPRHQGCLSNGQRVVSATIKRVTSKGRRAEPKARGVRFPRPSTASARGVLRARGRGPSSGLSFGACPNRLLAINALTLRELIPIVSW